MKTDKMIDQPNINYGQVGEEAERNIGFLVTNQFSMLPFVSCLEPLRIANRMAKKALYKWFIITVDGQPVTATNGIVINADFSIEHCHHADFPAFSMLFINGPHDPITFHHKGLLKWLVNLQKQGVVLGGIETGAYILAEAGLLKGVICTTHWEDRENFLTLFPEHNLSRDVYDIDKKIVTCAGGSASMDMMLHIIERHHEHELATSVADVMIHPHIRLSCEPQRMKVEERIGITHPTLVECIELMETNIDHPLSLNDITKLIGISKRQLERLFKKHLNTTPAHYYLTHRLEIAHDMLKKTDMRVIDVSIACGFKSSGYFSTCYKSNFGMTPCATKKDQGFE